MNNITTLKYLAILTGPLFGYVSLTYGGIWAWALPIYVYVMIPIIEIFTTASEKNMSEAEEQVAKEDRIYDYLLYMIVPIQFGLLFYFLYMVVQPGWNLFEIFGKTFSMGIACATFGINVGHELGHRAKKSERFLSKALLLSSVYMHFFIEHNRGHHKNVSTDEDPASSKRNETLYAFWLRSVRDSYKSAWHLEHERLDKKGLARMSWDNEMIRFTVIQIVFSLFVAWLFGWLGMFFYWIAGIIGFLLLETVNYIEHYGLRREKLDSGRWGKVSPVHSWNSNHAIGRIMLFELTRHSDHHYKASRKYQVLRHFDESPQLPYGYPTMIMMSFVPPLFFSVMNKQIDEYKAKYPEAALA